MSAPGLDKFPGPLGDSAFRVAWNQLGDRTSLPDALAAYLILNLLVQSRAGSFLAKSATFDVGVGVNGPRIEYRQIAENIRRRIGAGQYQPDTPIPTVSEIAEEFEVARTTTRRAVAVLREEGLVYTMPSRGSHVTRPSDEHG